MSFQSGDSVRVTNPESKYFGRIGQVSYAKVFAAEGNKIYIDYVVLFDATKKFGNDEEQFSKSSLELIKD
jgi:hypothetical protein